jgi:ubiquitin-like domain-containing CTD phosphatase 1
LIHLPQRNNYQYQHYALQRPLPELLDDYDGSLGPTPWNVEEDSEGIAIVSEKDFTNIFERLVNYVSCRCECLVVVLVSSQVLTSLSFPSKVVKHETFPYRYNDAALAKLGMGPLWKEIMTNILPITGASSNYTTFVPRTPPKLALFSGHDTTLMPILATLGRDVWAGTEWAPYASMILIELYEVDNASESEFASGFAFRLIYNGEVLTSRMDGCGSESELCDSQVLLDRVLPFAISEERDCASVSVSTDEMTLDDTEEDIIPEPKAVENEANLRQKWGMFGVAVLSATIGSVATCFLMRQHYQNAYRQASMLERELSMVENRDENNYGSNHDGVHNGVRTNPSVSSDYIEESDEDRII